MIKLIIFILVAYGIANIIIFGSIFEGFRNFMGVNKENPKFFGKLFSCFMCLSFWIGVKLSLIMYSPTMANGLANDLSILSLTIPKLYISTFFDACLASAGVWLIHTIQERIEV